MAAELAAAGGTAWGQNIDNGKPRQDAPAIGGAAVYQPPVGSPCPGCSNSPQTAPRGHQWGSGNRCESCGKVLLRPNVTITAENKPYDGSITATVTYTGSLGTDVGDTVGLVITGTFDNANAGANKSVTITGITLTDTRGGKYILDERWVTEQTEKSYSASITKLPLTVTANPSTVTYGSEPANSGVTYSGFLDVDNESALTGSLTYTYSYSRYGDVGSYTITPGGLDSDRYEIRYVSGTLTVNKKPITVTWGDTTHIYDGSPWAPEAYAIGAVNGDLLTLTVEGQQTKRGDYKARVTAIEGEKAGNYQLSGTLTTDFSIRHKEVTEGGKTYFLIETPEDLRMFAEEAAADRTINGRLANDIVLNTGVLEGGKLTSNASALASWTPIPNYKGIFDGSGHSISGLYITSSNSMVGFFSDCFGTIQNLTIRDSYIAGNNFVGALCGYLKSDGSITNCRNEGSAVTGNSNVGGIVGWAYGTVTDCANSGSVSGSERTGGIAGEAEANVKNCTNSGSVSGSANYTGGIVGHTTATVEGCTNSGSVSGSANYTGGIVGHTSATVEGCANSGSVSGSGDETGGIVGHTTATVEDCTNSGSVSGSANYTGGIVGYTTATVEGCTNSGSVSGFRNTGGIAGEAEANVTGCTNSGSVTGSEDQVGGICGYYYGTDAALSKCMNSGSVKGSGSYVGGVVGYLGDGSVTSCGNTGPVAYSNADTDTSSVGGIFGSKNYGVDDTVQYCYTIGTVTGNYSGSGPWGDADIDGTNYYLADFAEDGNETAPSARTQADFAFGKVAAELAAADSSTGWGQNIDNGSPRQDAPVIGGATVYSPPEDSSCQGCSNSPLTEPRAHLIGSDKLCQYCGIDPTVLPKNHLDLSGLDLGGDPDAVWIDGEKRPVLTEGGKHLLLLKKDSVLTTYTYKQNADGMSYPAGMKVYQIRWQDTGVSLEEIPAFENLLNYAGSSIRITGTKGIRVITGIDEDTRNELIDSSPDYFLFEYGTVVMYGEGSPTLDNSKLYAYAYRKNTADQIFARKDGMVQYTNVLVGFSLEDCKKELTLRPYITLVDKKTHAFVNIYGGCVTRSIGYIAKQNENTYAPGTDGYNYIHEIIDAVYGTAEQRSLR